MGLTFSLTAIMKVYNLINTLASKEEHMEQFLDMLMILYELSLDKDARTLASSSFAQTAEDRDSRRVSKAKQRISSWKIWLRLWVWRRRLSAVFSRSIHIAAPWII